MQKIIVLCQQGLPIKAFPLPHDPKLIDKLCWKLREDRTDLLRVSFCTMHPARTLDSVKREHLPMVTTEIVELDDPTETIAALATVQVEYDCDESEPGKP